MASAYSGGDGGEKRSWTKLWFSKTNRGQKIKYEADTSYVDARLIKTKA